MKVTRKGTTAVFEPVTVEITIESQLELDALQAAHHSLCRSTVVRDLSEYPGAATYANDIVALLERIYEEATE